MSKSEPVVAAVRVRPILTPLDPPLRTANGSTDTAPLLLIDIVSDTGITGHAYVFVYRPEVLAAVTQLMEGLATLLVGTSSAPLTAIRTLRRDMVLLGTAGLLDMALAGLDIALWDLLARSRELSLVRLLGGEPAPVRAYASFGMDGPEQMATAAATAAAAGFTAVKIKIGHSTVAEDLAVVRAVRSAVGPAVEILVDYNQCLSLPEALRRGQALDDEGIAWLEEPVAAEDLLGHARITRAIAVPVQLGENAWGPAGISAVLESGAGTLVMIDLVKVGGISGWLAATALCNNANRRYSDHFYQEVCAHLMTLSPGAHLLEYYGLADAVLASPLRAVNGYVTAVDQPGNGVDWDEDAVMRFRLDDRLIGTP